MDPLSVSASIIAVLQATNAVVSVCYDFRAVMKRAPWSLTRIINEVKDLRNVLESLERLADALDDTAAVHGGTGPAFELLCEPEKGPLATCLRELTNLEEKLTSSSCVGKHGSRRKVFIQVMGWKLKDRDAKRCLERLERCKSTLHLAITADEATLLLDIQDMTASLNMAVQNIEDNLTKLVVSLHSKDQSEKQRGISQWLSPLGPTENHDAVVKAHQNGTSNWFVESVEFSDWYCGDRSFLWLSGFPGAGKTVLFSDAVTYLTGNLGGNSTRPACVAYFYCDFRRRESQDPVNVIGSLVSQLCSQLARYPEELEHAYDGGSNNPAQRLRPSFSVLGEALQSFAKNSKIFLLIDALDECDRKRDILDFISMLNESTENINVLVTSRDESDIQEALHPFTRLRIESRLDEMDRDIRYYIDHRLQSDQKLQWLNPSVKADIALSLNEKSAGMFRWVQLQLDAIATLRTVKAIRLALQELPRGLNETYENILMKISRNDIEIVRRIFLWLAFAVLPLTLKELHEAVAIEKGIDHLDEESLLSSPQDILSLCGSLISVSDQGQVRLAHLSVKDYLLSDDICKNSPLSSFAITPGDANYELALDCITYLSFNDLTKGPSPTSDEYVDRLMRLPFLKHAATGWTYYARASNPTPKLKDHIFDFFSPQSREKFMSWVQVLNADYNFKWDIYPRHATSLYYAASFGLSEIVKALIDSGANLNAPGSRFGGTALHAAVLRYHIPVMKLLLEAGADPNRADFNTVTPLHSAVVYGNMDVISMLLEYGASKDAVDGVGETPFVWAVNAGQIESQNLLLGMPATRRADATQRSEQEVWKRDAPYFPTQFYCHRSGLDSSVILKVVLGSSTVELT